MGKGEMMERITRKKMPIRRDNLYHIEGHSLPSTTAILSILAKPYLLTWAAKMAAKAVLDDPDTYNTAEKASAVPGQFRDAAGGRGKAVHAMIEAWGKGLQIEDVTIEEQYEAYRKGFRTFLTAWRPIPLHTEVVVYNVTEGYAGQTDMVAQIGSEVWLLDFKTGKSIYFEYGLQLAAYKNSEFFRREGETAYPMMPVDHTGVVLLLGDGTFDFKEVNGRFDLFLDLKNAYVKLREEGQI